MLSPFRLRNGLGKLLTSSYEFMLFESSVSEDNKAQHFMFDIHSSKGIKWAWGFGGRRGFLPRYLQRDWQKTALFIPLLTPGLKEALSYRISPGREQVHTEAGSGLQSAAEVKEPGPPCAVRGTLQTLCVQYSVPAIPHHQQQLKQGLYYLQELHKSLPGSVWDLRFLHSLLGCSWAKEMRSTRINSLLCQTEHILYQCLQSPTARSRRLFLPQKAPFTEREII